MRSADKGEDGKKMSVESIRGLQRRQMMDEKDESKKMTEQNKYTTFICDGWKTITTVTVLQQRLEGKMNTNERIYSQS